MDLSFVKDLINSPVAVILILVPFHIGLWVLEHFFPAHDNRLREKVLFDLAALIFLLTITHPIANYAVREIGVTFPSLSAINSLAYEVRILLYLVVADFGHYWLHRFMHLQLLWPLHRWHHSPTHMSWSAGVRVSIPDAIIVNLAYLFAWPLLGEVGPTTVTLMLIFAILKNDWMHLNVNWRLKWLEWIIVTPRFHHVHHSDNPEHHGKNLGVLFSFWDRLFGTYINPDLVGNKLSLGIGEKVATSRMIIGV